MYENIFNHVRAHVFLFTSCTRTCTAATTLAAAATTLAAAATATDITIASITIAAEWRC